MKLSIIVPVYDAADTLERCLNSIGTWEGVELIVVNNGSTDTSAEIIERHPAPSRVITCLKNWGPSIGRNEGLTKATGDFVTFLDDDDEYIRGAVPTMLTAIETNPDADVLQFNHLRAYQGGTIMQKFYNAAGVYDAMNLPKLWPVVWNKVYRREKIAGIAFEPELTHGEDEVFNLRVFERVKKIHGVEAQTVVHHKDNPKSLTRQLTREDLEFEQAALIMFLKESQDENLRRAVCVRQSELWVNPTYLKLFGGGA